MLALNFSGYHMSFMNELKELFLNHLNNQNSLDLEHCSQVLEIDGQLTFTLQGLYDVLLLTDMSYSEFKKQLYASRFNEELSALGYQVVIYKAYGKVDVNWYQLTISK
ncbi:MAG: hypothetical protein ACJAS1_003713 [Oleiphilaceae bacterium]|jgi:hypothetical protein